MKLNDYGYYDIKVGDVFSFHRTISIKDIDNFAAITEDHNPLHCDEEYASKTKFGGRIAHGMLCGSLFSTLFGMVCPGKRNLYLSQSLSFKQPIHPNTELTIKGTVKSKIDSLRIIVVNTQVLNGKTIMIEGEAKIQIMGDQN